MSETDLNGKKVLIVDDEDLTRVLLARVLESLRVGNLEIYVAEDGYQAIEIATAKHPDLVLLDVLLPKMNGYDVCQELRRIPEYDPYIIMLTARGNASDRQQAEATGANDFMTKPFNPSRLVAQVREIWGLS